jgi:hypothetical protein
MRKIFVVSVMDILEDPFLKKLFNVCRYGVAPLSRFFSCYKSQAIKTNLMQEGNLV